MPTNRDPGLPSLSDPRRPKYWQHESSGVLKAVIARLLDPAEPRLSVRDINSLRLYFAQWVDSPAWDQDPHADARSRQALQDLRAGARTLHNRQEVFQWLEAATLEGMDPL